MSKLVKSLEMKELTARFKDVDAVAVINPRGIDATRTNRIRHHLHDKGVKMTVVKNTLARLVLGTTPIKGSEKLLDGPSALVYGEGSISTIARMLLAEKKDCDKLELRGIFFDGEVYEGEDGVTQVSKLPSREEAIGLVLASILSPGAKLGGIFKGQAGKIASLLKTVEEKAKDKEAAAPAAEAPAAAAPTA